MAVTVWLAILSRTRLIDVWERATSLTVLAYNAALTLTILVLALMYRSRAVGEIISSFFIPLT